jgi:hypothetical protein
MKLKNSMNKFAEEKLQAIKAWLNTACPIKQIYESTKSLKPLTTCKLNNNVKIVNVTKSIL